MLIVLDLSPGVDTSPQKVEELFVAVVPAKEASVIQIGSCQSVPAAGSINSNPLIFGLICLLAMVE